MQRPQQWFWLCLLLVLVSPADAQSRWVQYAHPTFGTRIAYPADVLPNAALSEAGAAFEGASARLDVSARSLPESTTVESSKRLMQDSPGYENITYSASGRNWLVVSGYRGGDIFYEKYVFIRGTVQGFSFRYRTAERGFYDPIVEAMENSFHPG